MATVKFRIRRDTAANWTATNPVLGLGEPGLETDTRKVKYGDGSTVWNSLPYSAAGAVAWGDITGKPTTLSGYGLTVNNGDWSGTDLAITNGGTGASSASSARTNLGLGTIATQDASAVTITGGTASGLSSLSVAGDYNGSGNITINATGGQGSVQIWDGANPVFILFDGAAGSGSVGISDFYLNGVLGGRFRGDTYPSFVKGPFRPGSFTVASVPDPADPVASGAGAMIYVSDESGGPVIAFSDGTNWRRCTDRNVIS